MRNSEMSAFHPENMWDGLYIGAKVYWAERFDNQLNPCGKIHGFAWYPTVYGKKDNGIVIEFPHLESFTIRYFVSFDDLKAMECWRQGEGGTFFISDAEFVELHKDGLVFSSQTRKARVQGKTVELWL
jgi:hypothetical protein